MFLVRSAGLRQVWDPPSLHPHVRHVRGFLCAMDSGSVIVHENVYALWSSWAW